MGGCVTVAGLLLWAAVIAAPLVYLYADSLVGRSFALAAAIAAGADGLIIECHHDPEHAESDGAQSLTPGAFADLMADVIKIAQALGRSV